jgi:hypothetical protein
MAGFQLSINGRFWVSTEETADKGNEYSHRRILKPTATQDGGTSPYVGKPMNEPYFWPYQNTILATAFTLQDKGWRERFEAIFDENLIFGTRAKMWYPVIRETIRIQEPAAYPLLPVDPMFKTDDEFLPLQACDLFAWCFREGTDLGPAAEDRPFEWLLAHLNHVSRSDHAQYYDEERLTSLMALSKQHQKEMEAGEHQELFDALTTKYRELWGRDYRRVRRISQS